MPARDAFADQQRLLAGAPVRTILDVGAHVGLTTASYLELFPDATIYALEPSPASLEEFRRKFAGISRVKPLGLGVAEASGTRALCLNRNSATNSLLPTAAAASAWVSPPADIETLERLEVPVTTLDDFCRREGLERIDILKFDIQGGELRALQGARELLRRQAVRLIYSEILFVPLYEGQGWFHEIAAFLAGYGYALFDMYNFVWSDEGQVKWGDAVFVPPETHTAHQRHTFSSRELPVMSEEPAAQTTTETPSTAGTGDCGSTIYQARPVWDITRRPRRPAISDTGFDMPGFVGHYYMWPEEYALLAKYVDLTEGDYLEIGSMCGIIAMSFALKYPQRKFVCVDAFIPGHATIAGNKEAFLQNLRAHNFTNVTLVEGNSLEVVPKLAGPFEIVLIDANHAYDYVLGDVRNVWPRLRPGGFVAFHDYDCVPETSRAVDDFLRESGACLVESATCLAVIRKPTEAERAQQQAVQESAGQQAQELESLREIRQVQTEELESLRARSQTLESTLRQIEASAGWRVLNGWRRFRNLLAPEGTARRRWYDSVLSGFRGSR